MASTYRSKVRTWYGSARWKAKRELQLALHPICKMCADQGRTTAARIADHRTPHKGDEQLFWHGKLDSLCKRCHDSDKQRIERSGKPLTTYGTDGWPVE